MNLIKLFSLLSILIFAGCKSQMIIPEDEPVATAPEKEVVTAEPKTEPAKKIIVKEEKFSIAEGESASLGSKRYYVILGSFGVYENAQNFKKQLMREDFFPGILVNENGLYRVCVNSYDDESDARNRVAGIRGKYTKYSDVWLLIKSED
jgi:cell division protein FtsN